MPDDMPANILEFRIPLPPYRGRRRLGPEEILLLSLTDDERKIVELLWRYVRAQEPGFQRAPAGNDPDRYPLE